MIEKINVIPYGTVWHRPDSGWPFDVRAGQRRTSVCGYITDTVVMLPVADAIHWCASCYPARKP